jgi:hypothetical protein
LYPSTDPRISNEKGIAFVTALFITLLLTLVVIALSYRVGLFTRSTRDTVIKSQNLYTAEIGLNQSRYILMSKDCLPPNWGASSCLPGINDKSFINLSSSLNSVFTRALPTVALADESYDLNLTGVVAHGSSDTYTYKIYAKTTNIPKVVEIMAVAERTGDQTQTVIDAGVIYTKPLGTDYKQLGQGGSKEGLTGESVGSDAAIARKNF